MNESQYQINIEDLNEPVGSAFYTTNVEVKNGSDRILASAQAERVYRPDAQSAIHPPAIVEDLYVDTLEAGSILFHTLAVHLREMYDTNYLEVKPATQVHLQALLNIFGTNFVTDEKLNPVSLDEAMQRLTLLDESALKTVVKGSNLTVLSSDLIQTQE